MREATAHHVMVSALAALILLVIRQNHIHHVIHQSHLFLAVLDQQEHMRQELQVLIP
jgi:hypothetical protein